jgi:glycosyltransferase involved in cell wall biosynthesis
VNPTPLVSVVVPTYNRRHLIARALRSVQAQSTEDWELLVVDDGSTDDTRSLIEAVPDRRIQYLRHEYNKGAAAARNMGMKHSRGVYVAFLDSDDEWLATKLERQLAVFSADPEPSVGVVYTLGVLRTKTGDLSLGRSFKGDVFQALLRLSGLTTTSGIMIRSSVVDPSEDLFDESLPAFQEWDCLARLAKKTGFAVVEDALYIMHYHGGPRVSELTNQLRARRMILSKYSADLARSPEARAIHYFRAAINCHRLGDYVGLRRELTNAVADAPDMKGWRALLLAAKTGQSGFNFIFRLYGMASRARSFGERGP